MSAVPTGQSPAHPRHKRPGRIHDIKGDGWVHNKVMVAEDESTREVAASCDNIVRNLRRSSGHERLKTAAGLSRRRARKFHRPVANSDPDNDTATPSAKPCGNHRYENSGRRCGIQNGDQHAAPCPGPAHIACALSEPQLDLQFLSTHPVQQQAKICLLAINQVNPYSRAGTRLPALRRRTCPHHARRIASTASASSSITITLAFRPTASEPAIGITDKAAWWTGTVSMQLP